MRGTHIDGFVDCKVMNQSPMPSLRPCLALQHCDTALDPHSTYEGFWWAHMGWLLDHEMTAKRVGNRSNAKDLIAQVRESHIPK